jgi:hypothetical protein
MSSTAMNLKTTLIAVLTLTAFLGAAMIAVAPLGYEADVAAVASQFKN